ncbi:hypothetical protein [Streptomyces sp. NPDC053728]
MIDEVRIPPLEAGVHQRIHAGPGRVATVGAEQGSRGRAVPDPSRSSA